MKYIGWLIFIVLCFPAGQVFHRIADLSSLGEDDGNSANLEVEEFTFNEGEGGLSVRIDPKSIKPEELPAKVTLTRRADLSSPDGTTVVTLEAGDPVRVISKDGANLTVSAMSGPLKGLVPMAITDCVEQVVKIRGARIFGGAAPAIAAVDPPEGPPVTPPPAPPQPPVVVQSDPPEPEPEPEPVPVEPEPEPEPEPAAAATLGPDAIVAAMKEHIQGGALKEFTLNQVQDWKAGEEEDVDGQTYQTGLVAYKAETIFGVKTVQAKALFQEGKIVKWVYAKTGMEIR